MNKIFDTLYETYADWYVHPEYNYGDNAAFREHMPTMQLLCAGQTVAELGIRHGTSTLAILSVRPRRLRSYDIAIRPTIERLAELAKNESIDFEYFEQSSLECVLEPVDVLLIDTLHDGDLLYAELTRHQSQVNKYIVMHDLVSFGHKNESGDTGNYRGLIPAMQAFLQENPQWEVAAYYYNCNGLMIFKRVNL